MADSISVTITVLSPDVQCYLVNFDVQPRQVLTTGQLRFTGYLSRYNNSPDDDGIVRDETIHIQIQSGGAWQDIATTPTRDDGTFYSGYFDVTLAPNFSAEGSYNFRAHYDGNSTKHLIGCE